MNVTIDAKAAPAPAHTLRLILGDQLNPLHSWFTTVQPEVVYVLMEIRQETDYVLHHAQKIIAIFAGMRDLALQPGQEITIALPADRLRLFSGEAHV